MRLGEGAREDVRGCRETSYPLATGTATGSRPQGRWKATNSSTPFGESPRTLPDPQRRGAYAPFVEDVRGRDAKRAGDARRRPGRSAGSSRRTWLWDGSCVCPAKRRKSTVNRRRSDAKTLRLRGADKSA